MKKLFLIIVLLNLSSCYSSKVESREQRKSKAIERINRSEENTEELFKEME